MKNGLIYGLIVGLCVGVLQLAAASEKRDMAICKLNGHSEATCFHAMNR